MIGRSATRPRPAAFAASAALAGLAALALFAAPAAAAARARAAGRAQPVRVRVSALAESQPLAPGFLGLALEDDEIPQLAGPRPASVNPVFVALLHDLDPAGHAVLRVGGQSTDRSWWPVPGMARPLGITYDLTPRWAADARALAQASGAQLIPGIELEADSRRIAQVEADELLRHIGRPYIDALEIGNEPELYRVIAWYKLLNGRAVPWYSPSGTAVFNRPPSYGPRAFVSQLEAILRVMPRVPIAAPSVGSPPWLAAFGPLIGRVARLRVVTWHAYGLNQCVRDPRSPHYPSVPNLLSIAASRRLTWGTSPYVTRAHAAGASFRIDELGSVSCNGRTGVSDTFASALWLLDALFNVAAQDIDGVNIHTYPGLPNDLFDFERFGGRWKAAVHPLYYGAMMFAQAAPAGSQLLRVQAGRQTQLRAWATLAPDDRLRVLLINDSLGASTQALVSPGSGFASPGHGAGASVERLLAASAYATSGVSIGGRTFGAWTGSGHLQPLLLQALRPTDGAYRLSLPPASAALLKLPADRPGVPTARRTSEVRRPRPPARRPRGTRSRSRRPRPRSGSRP